MLKVKELTIEFEVEIQRADEKALLVAIQKNYMVQSVKYVRFGCNKWLSSVDPSRLDFCLCRNRKLEEWLKDPCSLPLGMWPEAIALAWKTIPPAPSGGYITNNWTNPTTCISHSAPTLSTGNDTTSGSAAVTASSLPVAGFANHYWSSDPSTEADSPLAQDRYV